MEFLELVSTYFLSCLHGSERAARAICWRLTFLSCLHGSERFVDDDLAHLLFLSCLHGSELEVEKDYSLFLRNLRTMSGGPRFFRPNHNLLISIVRFLAGKKGSEPRNGGGSAQSVGAEFPFHCRISQITSVYEKWEALPGTSTS